MFDWIKMLNKMYEEHAYTCDGRVVVSYCADLDVVIVKVLDTYKVIEIDDFTDWGLLNKIQDAVREIYDSAETY